MLAEEEIVLTAPGDHRLARPGDVDLQELDGEALVHFAPDNGLSDWLTGRSRRRACGPSR